MLLYYQINVFAMMDIIFLIVNVPVYINKIVRMFSLMFDLLKLW